MFHNTFILKTRIIYFDYFLHDLLWKWLDHENGTAGGEVSPTLYRELLQKTDFGSFSGFSSVSGGSAGTFSKLVKPSSNDPQWFSELLVPASFCFPNFLRLNLVPKVVSEFVTDWLFLGFELVLLFLLFLLRFKFSKK